MVKIFISYARENAQWADRLKADLKRAGHDCWLDTSEILGGDEWVRSIETGIQTADACVSLVSRAALNSVWVDKESLFAERLAKPIIPALLENCTPRLQMIDRQCILLYQNYQNGLEQLLKALEELKQRQGKPSAHADIRRQRELAYLARLQLRELLHIELYTPLAGTARVQERHPELPTPVMRPEFTLLKRLAARQTTKSAQFQRFDDVIEAFHQAPRVVLLGEPGAGKTTALWRLAADVVRSAQADPAASIPLLAPLGKWIEPDQPLQEFIQQQLRDLGQHLNDLLQGNKALLLLDGLNEIPTAHRAEKAGQVRALLGDYSKLGAVVTCRELDYTGELQLDLDTLTIQPLDPPRILDFVTRYLGGASGEELFWRLAGGEAVRKVWEKWKTAGADLALFFDAEHILHIRTSAAEDAIWRSMVHDSRNLMRLACNPYLLFMLTQIYQATGELPANRAALFDQFVEILLVREKLAQPEAYGVQLSPEGEALLEVLGRLAWTLQTQGFVEDGYVEEGYVLTALNRAEADQVLNSGQLHQAAAASLLTVGPDEVRFTHQLLQEYFTARGLDQRLKAGDLQATELWPKERWWERSGWEEAAVLLVGFYENDSTPVIHWLAEANPEVAVQCILRSGATVLDRTLEELRALWLPRLTDLDSDPQPEARAAVGRALGSIRLHGRPLDNGPGVGLNERGLPDIDWVKIPGGQVALEGDAGRFEVRPFEIARHPITNIQFQAFIDDGGYETDDWWQGLAKRIMAPDKPHWDYANHPREMVSWYEAVAFCRWLSAHLGYEVRLPTEWEWQQAAIGGDPANTYPWGSEWREDCANVDESGLGQSTAVGMYPHGATHHGVMDMAGNVWEWCLNTFKPSKDTRLKGEAPRVVRGGSWFGDRDDARSAFRDLNRSPDHRNYGFGFRVCRAPPI